ncbi:5-oxoprolinase subunit B family protein [Streptomyces heilongjiangensis]|uniref:Allophanate hydrolase subunit 1 n=1 Tax=Streptomyces heilongjiangensis TaxID=945052 RepID=A0ABW1BBD4_9ACTN|nr:carboxyltransferase domain-containing protein [Streptomyces heilongjiangensis]MDC2951162.1 carboxyltransferase domain-containing protein [Streptomyces heilongjiangensis]
MTARLGVLTEPPRGTHYTFGGDEWIVVQLSEAMSLDVNLKAQVLTRALAEKALPGIVEICLSNASYMVRIDPDVVRPTVLVEQLRELEAAHSDFRSITLRTRIVDVPVLFEDEWTAATVQRFRDRHQRPDLTDLEFAAELNGYGSTDEFIDAMVSAPALVSMIGFVPTVPWGYQLVPEERQIEVPKYVRPRTFSPERAFAWGGAFSAIYPVDGAGGYQLFGMCPAPIVQPEQTLHDFRESFAFPRPGDLFNYRRIEREEFDEIRARVTEGSFRYRLAELDFTPAEWFARPDETVAAMQELLYGA